jgi:hypothetical protein
MEAESLNHFPKQSSSAQGMLIALLLGSVSF